MKKFFQVFMLISFSFLTGAKVVLLKTQASVDGWDYFHLGVNIFFIWFWANELYRTIKGK